MRSEWPVYAVSVRKYVKRCSTKTIYEHSRTHRVHEDSLAKGDGAAAAGSAMAAPLFGPIRYICTFNEPVISFACHHSV